MVHFELLFGRSLVRKQLLVQMRGFSLLELVLVLFVLGVIATAMAPSLQRIVGHHQLVAEARTLDTLVETIESSFDQTDLSRLNLAALPGTIGPGDAATAFSGSTGAHYPTTATNDWFAKVARLQGINPQVGQPPTAAVQPELARITFNGFGNPRLLFVGPTEPGRQRFLLISLAARADQLILPEFETGAAWFDAIWDHDWESHTAGLPAYWSSRLSPAERNAWTSGAAGQTRVHRLGVRRIVLPKYTVTVNNNHPTEQAFVSFNQLSPAFTAPANSGANVTPEILGGRLVTLNRGPVWPGVEALRFHLRENATVTLQ
jgi:prepilin-type N-terminal cleavage/methylation domain-containing protein